LGKIIIAPQNVARDIEQSAIKLHTIERMPAQMDVAPAVRSGRTDRRYTVQHVPRR
jgi:hypothetical protein